MEQQVHTFWKEKIQKFSELPKIDGFLSSTVIQETMFCSDERMMNLELQELAEDKSILNDYLGLIHPPVLFGQPLLISGYDPNTIHHTYHLNAYVNQVGVQPILEAKHIVEFGGGYGNFCRLVKHINKDCIYTIIDLPEILELQKHYLKNTLAKDVFEQIRFVSLPDHGVESCDLFIATWSLSECPEVLQNELFDSKLFGAKHLLASFHQCGFHIPFMKESTHFKNKTLEFGATLVENKVIPGINFYAFK